MQFVIGYLVLCSLWVLCVMQDLKKKVLDDFLFLVWEIKEAVHSPVGSRKLLKIISMEEGRGKKTEHWKWGHMTRVNDSSESIRHLWRTASQEKRTSVHIVFLDSFQDLSRQYHIGSHSKWKVFQCWDLLGQKHPYRSLTLLMLALISIFLVSQLPSWKGHFQTFIYTVSGLL